MKTVLTVFSILAMSATVLCELCDFDSCKQQVCPEVSEENCNGRFEKNGSICWGCCDVCYRILEPGAKCADPVAPVNKDEYVYEECPKGYFCDYLDSWTCVESRY